MFDFSRVNWEKVQDKTIETLIMTFESLIAVFLVGLFLGLLLYLTSNSKSAFGRGFYAVVTAIVNIFRAIPFIILIVLLIPFTKFLIGTIIGVQAAIPALIISAAPFYARLVEIGLREVDKGVIEAARAMGAKNSTIILKVLIPESLPAIISGLTVTAIALVGSTAMAGVIGAGGLGNLAYLDGFQRNNSTLTFVATVLILIIVFAVQILGDTIVKKVDKR
ncbi:MAG: ABC transporter permease [Gemella haemolysans]|jgi:D-methionine transport system permease protein metI|uniref:Putative D-methionine transport system permease protein MetI n=1 Tax=Gemella haemolysans TaxID=1379 RepID=A0A133ZY54_9BACL|nr:methionine ABC transporter permease [Gemella haemolysans]TKW64381.1 MAG: ABC transporter permease [Gemella sp.]KXB60330.1 putative D-methionine transport system permease protein MetI [Gemella haemolysans]MBS5318328.1 ABC transporter permease [Gemella haemolysans]MDU3831916.1 methionine ABC transporter permease [Gemella haemolysans]MDU8070252.1 methionine ABC transporter permease [Gemella haemolysans]